MKGKEPPAPDLALPPLTNQDRNLAHISENNLSKIPTLNLLLKLCMFEHPQPKV